MLLNFHFLLFLLLSFFFWSWRFWNWFIHSFFDMLIDLFNIFLYFCYICCWLFPLLFVGLFFLNVFNPSLHSLNQIKRLLSLFNCYVLIFFILNYLNYYQWVKKFKIHFQTVYEIADLLSNSMKNVPSFYYTINLIANGLYSLSIDSSTCILSLVI